MWELYYLVLILLTVKVELVGTKGFPEREKRPRRKQDAERVTGQFAASREKRFVLSGWQRNRKN